MDLSKYRHFVHYLNVFSPIDKGYVCIYGNVIGGTARKPSESLEICIDSGTGVSIIDHNLAIYTLGLQAQRTKTIRLRGIGDGTISKYVTFKLKFSGSNKIIDVTAYLYKSFPAGILLGNDTIEKHRINVLTTKHVITLSNDNDVIQLPFVYKKVSDGNNSLSSVNHITCSALRNCLKGMRGVYSTRKSVIFATNVQPHHLEPPISSEYPSQSYCKEINCVKAAKSDRILSSPIALVSSIPAPRRLNHLRSLPYWRLPQQHITKYWSVSWQACDACREEIWE